MQNNCNNGNYLLGVLFICGIALAFMSSYLLQKEQKVNDVELKPQNERIDDLRRQINNLQAQEIRLCQIVDNLRGHLSVEMISFKEDITKMFTQMEKKLDEDKTGKTDYALNSIGGRILKSSATYDTCSKGGKPLLQLCDKNNKLGPEAIISPNVMPGQCWPMKDSKGFVIIQLMDKIRVSGMTIEHIPTALAPSGKISSAPNEISLRGLKSVDDKDGFLFGHYNYNIAGPPRQTFDVKYNSETTFNIVEVRINSNHGNSLYTCIYRIRIHGSLPSFGSTGIHMKH